MPGPHDNKTLSDSKFKIGDYLDIQVGPYESVVASHPYMDGGGGGGERRGRGGGRGGGGGGRRHGGRGGGGGGGGDSRNDIQVRGSHRQFTEGGGGDGRFNGGSGGGGRRNW